MTTDYLTEDVRSVIGVAWPSFTSEVDNSGIRAWARAVGYQDRVYYDEAVARARGFSALPAPPGFVGTIRSGPGDPEPGPPIRGLHPDLVRSLNGGTDLELRRQILAGDVLTATTTITDIVQRQGSIGPMLIISRETTYRRRQEIVAILRATVINY